MKILISSFFSVFVTGSVFRVACFVKLSAVFTKTSFYIILTTLLPSFNHPHHMLKCSTLETCVFCQVSVLLRLVKLVPAPCGPQST